jgi:hypothetical protein
MGALLALYNEAAARYAVFCYQKSSLALAIGTELVRFLRGHPRFELSFIRSFVVAVYLIRCIIENLFSQKQGNFLSESPPTPLNETNFAFKSEIPFSLMFGRSIRSVTNIFFQKWFVRLFLFATSVCEK